MRKLKSKKEMLEEMKKEGYDLAFFSTKGNEEFGHISFLRLQLNCWERVGPDVWAKVLQGNYTGDFAKGYGEDEVCPVCLWDIGKLTEMPCEDHKVAPYGGSHED